MADNGIGRYVYGAFVALLGLVAVLMHANNPDVPDFSLGIGFVYVTSVVQILGGILVLWQRTLQVGALVLVVVLAVLDLLRVPEIVQGPTVYNTWGDVFFSFSLLCGALILYGQSLRAGRARTLLSRIGYFGFGVSVISFALEQAFYLHETAVLVPSWIPLGAMFWSILTTVAFVLAAIAILTGYQALLASRLTTLMLLLFGLLVWIPALVHHPGDHFSWSETMETFTICGVTWIVADLLRSREKNLVAATA
jgi:hypothetical protein